jgi:hypothetical protein
MFAVGTFLKETKLTVYEIKMREARILRMEI